MSKFIDLIIGNGYPVGVEFPSSITELAAIAPSTPRLADYAERAVNWEVGIDDGQREAPDDGQLCALVYRALLDTGLESSAIFTSVNTDRALIIVPLSDPPYFDQYGGAA